MKLVFMGTPEFAAVSLRRLAEFHTVSSAVCMPDRPAGRGKKVFPSAVKSTAEQLSIPVLQPVDAGSLEGDVKRLNPDAVCVVAYGNILPPRILALVPGRFINLHASLLPAYRGAAPIHRAVMAGDTRTGLTTMLIDDKLDSGDILLTREMEIGDEENSVELSHRMAAEGADLLLATLEMMEKGSITPRPQDHLSATYAPMLTKEDGRIDWTKSASEIINLVRGTVPWPGAFTRTDGGTLKILRARSVPESGEPGEILDCSKSLIVASGDNAVEALEVQAEGRNRMAAADFLAGARIKSGDRFR